MPRYSLFIIVRSILAAFVSWSSFSYAAPVADYGDVADPSFPSLHASNGPRHLDISREWLGVGSTTTTTVEPDSRQVNADQDDNYAWLLPTNLGDSYFLVTRVSYDPLLASKNEVRYLNAMLDVNRSGTWEAFTNNEWIVRNQRVPLSSLPSGINTLGVCMQIEPNNLLRGVDLRGAALRLTLSTAQVNSDPRGAWGELERGETEDILLGSGDPPMPGGWTGGGGPGGPGGGPGGKIEGLIREGGLDVAVTQLRPLSTCPHCGVISRNVPLCPGHVDVRKWTVTIPKGTSDFRAGWFEVGGCGNAWCAATDLSESAFGANPWAINTWSPDLIAGPLPAAVVETFTGNGALTVVGRHVSSQFRFEYVLDPDGEYWYVSGYLQDEDHTVPEPSTLAGIALTVAIMTQSRREKHTELR